MKESLYDKALKIAQANELLYDRWEKCIAAYMEKKWPKAFETGAEISGSDRVTVLEVADMGEQEVKDHDLFLDDLRGVFRTLAKGCQLNTDGDWC